MGKVLAVVLIFAVATYLITRAMQARGNTPVRRRPSFPDVLPKPKPRPSAPDDDEDFLRDLDRKRRKKKRQNPPPEDS
ncbi:hypothetical protein KUV85_15880 [Nocardioides panacisoli]|uniref:hypothetical protein n=1 Tax=Nocardioides panacisoli TaxID=627624 RepID=UPI001C6294D6|nr:hypothetical protein [Nocardioides panacisoli]QYJ03786.1 hypothetical protein KUV85_15880 [Nocardioides panacisoli]